MRPIRARHSKESDGLRIDATCCASSVIDPKSWVHRLQGYIDDTKPVSEVVEKDLGNDKEDTVAGTMGPEVASGGNKGTVGSTGSVTDRGSMLSREEDVEDLEMFGTTKAGPDSTTVQDSCPKLPVTVSGTLLMSVPDGKPSEARSIFQKFSSFARPKNSGS